MAQMQTGAAALRWRGALGAKLLNANDDGYHTFRQIWNGMTDRRPSLIARCTSAEDVRAAVKLARTEQLRVSVRGGGHNIAGTALCDGGLMIDVSPMKEVRVDAERREAIASPGLLWGEFDRATQAHGLATTGGQVSHTGIAGLTLGGGLGYLMGKHGAACDNILSLDLVTADGEMLTCSVDQNKDLFWAMRGAGANFGVVTSFRYRLHPLEQILAGIIMYPREKARDLITFHRDFLRGTPDELDTTIAFLNSPERIPLVAVIAVYAGPPTEGDRVLAPLRKFESPIADLIRPMSYIEAQSMADDLLPIGDRYYWKSSFASELSNPLASILSEGATSMPSPGSMILLFEIKGAIQRVPRDAAAFDHRDANFELSIVAHWKHASDDALNIQWARELWSSAQPFVSTAGYLNHMTADEPEERVRAAYGFDKYNKLVELKRVYDPDNFFSQNNNIRPPQS
jgi:FAD/FMN-containing dehydrogenase